MNKLFSISSLQMSEIRRPLIIAWNQMQFLRSPLLHKLDQIALNTSTATINFKNACRRQKRKISKLMNVTDNNYSDLVIPREILIEILTFSNDYYDHILSMHNNLSKYQYVIPQILNLFQFIALVTLLLLPPNCIFFCILFNLITVNEIYEIPSINYKDEYEYLYTDHELFGFFLFILSTLQLLGCVATLYLNYKTEYCQKWIVLKHILRIKSSFPFELLYPFQKWCCVPRNYYLTPHNTFNNLQLLRNSIHSFFWQWLNPLYLYIIYCLFKPLLCFMLSIYYWKIYRFSMNYNGFEFIFFLMMLWFFGIFLYRDILRIIVDGWIGSRISCLIIAQVYLQIYCNNLKYKNGENIELLNIILLIIAASLYKSVEYLLMNMYFKSYVPINHIIKHSIQQFIYDWYSAFFILLVYLYGFGWLFIANHGEYFTLSQTINSVLRLIIGVLIYIDAQLDILIFDKSIQSMSKMDVLRQILFGHEYKLMTDWKKTINK